MFDQEKLDKRFESAMKNDYFREEWENAPSNECRNYLMNGYRLEIVTDQDKKDALAEREAVFDSFAEGDWRYIMKWCGNNMMRGYLRKRMREHGFDPDAPTRQEPEQDLR